MITWLLLTLLVQRYWCFILEGSSISYAQFAKWNVCSNGSLELEFNTEQGNGLLLYTDDGGTYDFFELKLIESAVRLRYNLGGGTQILIVGHDLADANWHKVQITRNNENTTLTVDGLSSTSTSRGTEYDFGRFPRNSDIYVGGMPSWYNSKLTLLALPSVIFEPRFNGLIRNLVYADNDNAIPRRQEMKRPHTMKSRSTVISNTTDSCGTNNPCQHGGVCISIDTGIICECRNLDYSGEYCEKDSAPPEASFKGTEYLQISVGGSIPLLSMEELISLQFKTRQHNGLLFHSGEKGDYLSIALKDGGVAVGMVLANGRLDLHIKPTKIRFDDHQWHKIIVQRRVQEISPITRFCKLSAIVDGIYTEHAHTAGSFTHLASEQLLVGGGVAAKLYHDAKEITNFVGCLRKVIFKADGLEIELIQAAENGIAGATSWGKVDFHCNEPKTDPITFTTRDSHLVLPPWRAAASGSISFKIRTNEPTSLLMYSRSGASTRPDFFAFEILDGHIYLHLDLGSGHLKVRASKHRIDNGTWHDVAMRRVDRDGRVTVDGESTDFHTSGESTLLDLDGLLFIGGIGVPFAPLTVPPVLWSGALRQGYVGCIRDLVINGQPIDIAGYAQQQDSGAVRPACHTQPAHCSSQPCMNGGLCIEGWNRFHCDCTATSFIGPICSKEASTLYLNGSEQLTALMPENSRTQAEEVSLRFKTTKPIGLLFGTSLDTGHDKLQLMLEKGILKVKLSIGDREKIFLSGQGLNDDMWHTIRFSRRASSIHFQIDDEPTTRAEIHWDADGILSFQTLHVGGYSQSDGDSPHFIGQLQQVFFNGHPFLEMARSAGNRLSLDQDVTPTIKVTGRFGKRNHPVHNPVTFTSKHTFLGLPVLKAYIETNVYFQFKTRETNGLILFNGGRERDFIAVAIIGGHIHYVFNLGDGPIRIKDSSKSRLNDGKWHAVSISRPAPKQHVLAVDDHVTAVMSHGSNENLDLDGILYIGGVEESQYIELEQLSLLSHDGFEGCLASLDLSGESIDLLSDAIVPSSLVISGCSVKKNLHPGDECTQALCANRGTCVQEWNVYTCDCDMTSFSGPFCNDGAVAYEFGPGCGLFTYSTSNNQPSVVEKNTVAMGFMTSVNDAILMRIESGTSKNYIEIALVDGYVFAVYNIDTNDHPVGDSDIKVNDNQYHVVRFTKYFMNATLQIDDYKSQINHWSDDSTYGKSTHLGGEWKIQVGGRWNRTRGSVERPFLGIISGLVVNGVRILELAMSSSNRVTLSGDIRLLPPGSLQDKIAPLQRMQQTPASDLPGVMDDLIFSGAGSGCAGDDEDDCTPIYDSTSDDLITPVYVAPTRMPVTIKSKTRGKFQENSSCDDEEDCGEGSGDPIMTKSITVTSTAGTTLVVHTTQRGTSEILTSTTTSMSSVSMTSSSQTFFPLYNLSTTGTESPYNRTNVTLRGSIVETHTTAPITKMTNPPQYQPETFPPIPTQPKIRESPKIPTIHSDAAKNAALVIAIIAGALIAIVLIIILILKFKNRPDAHYKVDGTKFFCQDPNAALLSASGSGQQYNDTFKTNTNISKSDKKSDLKDIKEWYV